MTNEYNPDGKEIRFIDSHYKDLFHIPDGSCVQIHYPDETVVKPCTFIDEYHTQIEVAKVLKSQLDKIDSPKRESVMEKLAQAAEKAAPASPSPKRKEPER